jgi:hypothetical protein
LYQINNYGRVKSLKRLQDGRNRIVEDHFINQFDNTQGYKQISLFKNHKKRNYRVHRLVAETFIPNPNNYNVVNHIDGNKLNNNVSNLEWATYKQNTNHAWKIGLCSTEKFKHYTTKVVQLDKQNNILKIYNSQKEASIDNNIRKTAINNCLRGINKTSGGYKWRYFKEGDEAIGS